MELEIYKELKKETKKKVYLKLEKSLVEQNTISLVVTNKEGISVLSGKILTISENGIHLHRSFNSTIGISTEKPSGKIEIIAYKDL